MQWNFGFRSEIWCTPLLSWHKTHSGDIARYYELEKSWDFKVSWTPTTRERRWKLVELTPTQRPMLHGNFFERMIAPVFDSRREWWDNLSSLFDITSANANLPLAPQPKYNHSLYINAWKSVDACEAACESWDECMQWSYYDDLCRMDDKLIMGSGFAPRMFQRKARLIITSGWL